MWRIGGISQAVFTWGGAEVFFEGTVKAFDVLESAFAADFLDHERGAGKHVSGFLEASAEDVSVWTHPQVFFEHGVDIWDAHFGDHGQGIHGDVVGKMVIDVVEQFSEEWGISGVRFSAGVIVCLPKQRRVDIRGKDVAVDGVVVKAFHGVGGEAVEFVEPITEADPRDLAHGGFAGGDSDAEALIWGFAGGFPDGEFSGHVPENRSLLENAFASIVFEENFPPGKHLDILAFLRYAHGIDHRAWRCLVQGHGTDSADVCGYRQSFPASC